jgi:hypothetical protein
VSKKVNNYGPKLTNAKNKREETGKYIVGVGLDETVFVQIKLF